MIEVGRDLERIRDYVAGRLSDDEQRAFEDRLSRDPGLVREVELSQRLREGLERLRDGGLLDVPPRQEAPRRRIWAVGLAATIAVAAVLFWLQPAGHSRPELLSAAPSTRPAVAFTFLAMRGPSAPPLLQLPAHGVVEIRASRLAATAGTRYRVVLDRMATGGTRETVGGLDGLEAGTDGLVHVYADADGLFSGEYELRLQVDGDSSAGVEVFPFLLQSAPL